MRELARAWRAAAITLVVIVATIMAIERLWVDDFKPFVMTIEEWNRARVEHADGTTIAGAWVYRLEYQRRGDWKMTLIHDDLGTDLTGEVYECRNDVYLRFDARGNLNGRIDDAGLCLGVGRWIGYGMAESVPWARTVSGSEIAYVNGGERVIFDRVTGLPLLYEVTSRDGVVGERTIFRLERYGST